MSFKKISGIICGCVICLWFTACFEVTKPEYFNDSGDTLVLKFGETKIGKSSGVRLTFTEVLEDSRCPINLMCFIAGRAIIQVSLKKPLLESVYLALPLNGYVSVENSMHHVAVDTLGYSLKLLQLDPYPEDSVEPDISTYQAIISIEQY